MLCYLSHIYLLLLLLRLPSLSLPLPSPLSHLSSSCCSTSILSNLFLLLLLLLNPSYNVSLFLLLFLNHFPSFPFSSSNSYALLSLPIFHLSLLFFLPTSHLSLLPFPSPHHSFFLPTSHPFSSSNSYSLLSLPIFHFPSSSSFLPPIFLFPLLRLPFSSSPHSFFLISPPPPLPSYILPPIFLSLLFPPHFTLSSSSLLLSPYRDEARRGILGADVTLAAEGADGDGVPVQGGKVVAEAAVSVPNTAERHRRPPAEPRDEGGAQDGLGGAGGGTGGTGGRGRG